MANPDSGTGGGARPPKPPLRVVDSREDPRVDILLTPDTAIVTDKMIAALSRDPGLYVRDRYLVRVLSGADSHEIDPVPLRALVDRVSRVARCVRAKRGEDGFSYTQVEPPESAVNGVRQAREYPGLRPLRGIIQAPTLRRDFSILQTPGYDSSTELLYLPNAKFAPVPESPTHSDAVVSYSRLASLYRQFPFVDESHLAATVSAILTLVGRSCIPGSVPGFVFDASGPRIGKSLMVDTIALIASGRLAPRATWSANDEEIEKVVSGYIDAGARMISFDNVSPPVKFGGSSIEKVLTSGGAEGFVDYRILGKTGQRSQPSEAVIFASGNNIEYRSADMNGRTLRIRVVSPLENPEERTDFEVRDLAAHVLARRGELAAAALTILRAYGLAGCPDAGQGTLGGFASWARIVAGALVWLGAPNPLAARPRAGSDDDPRDVSRALLLREWVRLEGSLRGPGGAGKGVSATEVLGAVYPPPRPDEGPDTWRDLRAAIGELSGAKGQFPPSTRALTSALRQFRDRPIAGFRMVSSVHPHSKVTLYLSERIR